MKIYFKPLNILFYVLSALVFFFLGMVFAGLTGVADGQGLAGGAIIFGYGVISGFLAFIISIFSVGFLKQSRVRLITKILAVIFVLFFAFFTYRYQRRAVQENPTEPTSKKVATLAVAPLLPTMAEGGLNGGKMEGY